MAYKGFKEIRLVGTQSVEDWYIANESIVDEDTLYTFTNEDGTEIIAEYIGNRFKVGVQETDFINYQNEINTLLNNKVDKDFTSLPNQATPLLTDVMVLNRGTTAQKTTLGALLALVGGTNILVDALCWRGTCEAVPAEAAIDALTWR